MGTPVDRCSFDNYNAAAVEDLSRNVVWPASPETTLAESVALDAETIRPMVRVFIVSVLILTANVSLVAQQPEHSVRFHLGAGVLFLNAADVASALQLKLEVVRPGQLLTFCREGDDGFCIPVCLTAQNHRGNEKTLQLTAAVVRSSLAAEIVNADGTVKIKLSEDAADSDVNDTPAYNADWGPGRGFRRGDTVPDLPFVDLDGNEVRFSKFLGKRYILYCWASW
jgi:hypothetical protein